MDDLFFKDFDAGKSFRWRFGQSEALAESFVPQKAADVGQGAQKARAIDLRPQNGEQQVHRPFVRRVEPDRAPQSREHRLRLRNSLKPRMGNRNAMSDSGRAEALTAKHCRKNGTATQPSLVAEPGSQSDERRPLVVGRQAQHDILLSKESDDVRPIRRGLAEALSGERFRIVNCAEVEKVACARPGCETGIRVATASVIEIPD